MKFDGITEIEHPDCILDCWKCNGGKALGKRRCRECNGHGKVISDLGLISKAIASFKRPETKGRSP